MRQNVGTYAQVPTVCRLLPSAGPNDLGQHSKDVLLDSADVRSDLLQRVMQASGTRDFAREPATDSDGTLRSTAAACPLCRDSSYALRNVTATDSRERESTAERHNTMSTTAIGSPVRFAISAHISATVL